MMTPTGDPGSARYESLGYVEFCTRLEDDPAFAKWFHRLRSDIDQVAASKRSERSRLIVLQNKIIDLIEFLDPDRLRFPANRRDRLVMSSEQASTADADPTTWG